MCNCITSILYCKSRHLDGAAAAQESHEKYKGPDADQHVGDSVDVGEIVREDILRHRTRLPAGVHFFQKVIDTAGVHLLSKTENKD